ncbi:MAG: hypothetical protein KJO43_07900 [Phycisphaerae bacterium]|nr:hypothetical protein [Phycisphaerae bacterium]
MNRSRLARFTVTLGSFACVFAFAAASGGCAIGHLIGGMLQNEEYQKLVETPPEYADLSGKRIAVVVDADLSVTYNHPKLVEMVTTGVTMRIGRDVPEAAVVHPQTILAWQWRTPQWNAMPYADLCESLNVDRVVFIDIYEYRLNPPGNRWLWEGVCAASVGVIEREGFDPDMFADSFNVTSNFPSVTGVERTAASEGQIETGLLAQFIQKTAWLFHDHLEPKYPDKYRPEAQAQR